MLKKLVIVGSLLAVGPLLAGCLGAVVMGVQAIPLVLEVADATVEGIASVTKKTPKKTSSNVHTKTSPKASYKGAKNLGFITTNIASQTNNQLCRSVFGAPFNSAPRLSALDELRARGEQNSCRGGKHHSHSQSHLMSASRFDWMSKGELCHLAT